MVALTILKLTLAPALVGGASLASRRFGPRAGGWLIGFPVVAAPVLGFYAREQGALFAARAAAGTLLGVIALCVFMLLYLWSARRWGWAPSLAVGWLGFVATTLLVAAIPGLASAGWPVGLAAAVLALSLTLRLLPDQPPAPPPARRSGGDLLVRMAATAVLVVSLTAVARLLGPTLSGLFTPFPVATTVLVVFAHREGGQARVRAVYAGFIPSLYSFAGFLAALSFGLLHWTPPVAFAVALFVTLACQGVVLGLVR